MIASKKKKKNLALIHQDSSFLVECYIDARSIGLFLKEQGCLTRQQFGDLVGVYWKVIEVVLYGQFSRYRVRKKCVEAILLRLKTFKENITVMKKTLLHLFVYYVLTQLIVKNRCYIWYFCWRDRILKYSSLCSLFRETVLLVL